MICTKFRVYLTLMKRSYFFSGGGWGLFHTYYINFDINHFLKFDFNNKITTSHMYILSKQNILCTAHALY